MQPGLLPEFRAKPSSPEPRTKQFDAVRKFPALLFGATFPLLRLMPSAQVQPVRVFLTIPVMPLAQTPAPKCCIQQLSTTQLLPFTLRPPPLPCPLPPPMAFESKVRFRTTQECGSRILEGLAGSVGFE